MNKPILDEKHPSHPKFWDKRYLSGEMPWDFKGIPADLRTFLKKKGKGARVLIPGCGRGHEIKAFADAGYEVTAIDFSPAAVERARALAGPELGNRVLLGDFFTHDFPAASFDFIYERNFVCALVPERRPAYRDRMAQLLKYRGALLGYFYYQKLVPGEGPPFGFAWGSADELFSRYFLLVRDVAVSDSLPVFAGRERWQEWHRTSFKD